MKNNLERFQKIMYLHRDIFLYHSINHVFGENQYPSQINSQKKYKEKKNISFSQIRICSSYFFTIFLSKTSNIFNSNCELNESFGTYIICAFDKNNT